MAPSREHLQQTQDFIRQHRSNEANFSLLQTKLEEELTAAKPNKEYYEALLAVKEKQLAAYTEAQKNRDSAWPEFENFITSFERTIAGALNEDNDTQPE
jgi:hypothetical protein